MEKKSRTQSLKLTRSLTQLIWCSGNRSACASESANNLSITNKAVVHVCFLHVHMIQGKCVCSDWHILLSIFVVTPFHVTTAVLLDWSLDIWIGLTAIQYWSSLHSGSLSITFCYGEFLKLPHLTKSVTL